jgi:drug/metabolite transporter (DMT)-like permease
MTSPTAQRTRAILSVAGGAAIIGLAPVGMRLSELGPQATAFWRFAFALPALALLVLLTKAQAPARRDVRLLVIAGACFALDMALWHAALGLTTVANATLFSNMTPVLAAAAGFILFRERIGVGWLVGASIAVIGAALMSFSRAQGGQGTFTGDLLGLASAVWYAAYLLVLRGVRERVSAPMTMLITTAAAAVVAAIATVVMGEPLVAPHMTAHGWLVLVVLGVFIHVGGQGLIAYGLGQLPITLSTVLLWTQPVAAAVFGWLLFNEGLGAAGVVGAVMILAGVYVVQRSRSS